MTTSTISRMEVAITTSTRESPRGLMAPSLGARQRSEGQVLRPVVAQYGAYLLDQLAVIGDAGGEGPGDEAGIAPDQHRPVDDIPTGHAEVAADIDQAGKAAG